MRHTGRDCTRKKRKRETNLSQRDNANRRIALYVWRVRAEHKKNNKLSFVRACGSFTIVFMTLPF